MTAQDIKALAEQFSKEKKNWHFHILTPECQLNDSDKFALVLEDLTDNQDYVVCSDEPYLGVGRELVKLLHGDDVVKDEPEENIVPPSEQVGRLLVRAKQLTEKEKFWHHHMLFPGCKYNKHGNKWVIVFEDQEQGKIIESVSENEPKSDLQHIERLFYNQQKQA